MKQEQLDAGVRRRIPGRRPVLSPSPLFSLSSSLSLSPLPRCSDAAARTREYRRAISRLFPCARKGMVRFFLRTHPPSARVASPRRLGGRGDAIRTKGVARETPQFKKRLDD